MMASTFDKGSDETVDQNETARANHACSACHRRKLKCDRELPPRGCDTCRKSNIPCLYTDQRVNGKVHDTTRAGRKKVRGPYRKGQTPREKELENYVALLTKKCSDLEAQLQLGKQQSDSSVEGTYLDESPQQTVSTETCSNTYEAIFSQSSLGPHSYAPPKPALMLELWLRFVFCIDPFFKLIHCPTVSHVVPSAKEHPNSLPIDFEALMLSIYIASLNSLDVNEISTEIDGRKEDLMSTYRLALEQLLLQADNNVEILTFTFLQAALVYLGTLRRHTGDDRSLNITALFELILRFARRLRVDDPEMYSSLTPFEAEYRRRAWWTICRYRSAYAEDFGKGCALLNSTEIALPSNYNDSDLEPYMSTYPVPREGLSESSIIRMQFQVVKFLTQLAFPDTQTYTGETTVHARMKLLVEKVRTEIEQEILVGCDESRPFDRLILLSGKVLLSKVEITLLEALYKVCPDLNFEYFHNLKVPLALDIIECHQKIIREPCLQRWQWYWKQSHQWHSTIYVLEELARRPEADFASRAWEAMNLVLTSPGVLDKHGMNIETRNGLLDSHGRALQARERLIHRRTNLVQARSSKT